MSMGELIRIPMPPLSEERRRELTKVAKSEGEHARVGRARTAPRGQRAVEETAQGQGGVGGRRAACPGRHPKLTDRYIVEIDKLLSAKEQEIMTI
jgi:ribosome recycling factor